MRLFSYCIARDYGFAPNPFFGFCSLATCKPEIRRVASIGDWIVGTGSRPSGYEGYLVFSMKVDEILSFNEYWNDARFVKKRPNLYASLKDAYGDNIYHWNSSRNQWDQENSHHSCEDGSRNNDNIAHDTQTNRVLVSTNFMYWGKEGVPIPSRFRDYEGYDICATRGHKSRFPDALVRDFVSWLNDFEAQGFLGEPIDW